MGDASLVCAVAPASAGNSALLIGTVHALSVRYVKACLALFSLSQGIYHRSLRPMPARFHYGRSERIMPILLLAKRGFKVRICPHAPSSQQETAQRGLVSEEHDQVSTSSRRDTNRGNSSRP